MVSAMGGNPEAVVLATVLGQALDFNASNQLRIEVAAIPPSDISGQIMATDVLHASAAETATNFSTDRDYSKYKVGAIVINITAVAGTTPTLVLLIDGKDPLSGNYFTQWNSSQAAPEGTGGNIVAVQTVVVFLDESTAAIPTQNLPTGQTPATLVAARGRPLTAGTFRLRWVIGGTTPSFTFSAYALLKPT